MSYNMAPGSSSRSERSECTKSDAHEDHPRAIGEGPSRERPPLDPLKARGGTTPKTLMHRLSPYNIL
jgi:hypothetical protein